MSDFAKNKPTSILKLQQEIKKDIEKFDFFSLLRYLELDTSLTQSSNGRFEQALTPHQEQIRISQIPDLSFPTSEIRKVELADNKINISVNSFGLLSINSPLPIHLLEHIFERKHHYGDSTWMDFINLIQHRLFLLFYQGWATAQSTISLENKSTKRFDGYIHSLIGLDNPQKNDSHLIDDYTKIFFSGFQFKNRSSHNLVKLLSQYFKVKISIIENIGEWYEVDESEQTCLGVDNGYTLADGLLLGNKIYDRHTKFRVVIGPLNLDEYQSFFKGEYNYQRLTQWLNDYIGLEYKWEIQPILYQQSIPPLQLSTKNRLGLTSWLGNVDKDSNTLVIQ